MYLEQIQTFYGHWTLYIFFGDTVWDIFLYGLDLSIWLFYCLQIAYSLKCLPEFPYDLYGNNRKTTGQYIEKDFILSYTSIYFSEKKHSK